jgi:hypothetical protein
MTDVTYEMSHIFPTLVKPIRVIIDLVKYLEAEKFTQSVGSSKFDGYFYSIEGENISTDSFYKDSPLPFLEGILKEGFTFPVSKDKEWMFSLDMRKGGHHNLISLSGSYNVPGLNSVQIKSKYIYLFEKEKKEPEKIISILEQILTDNYKPIKNPFDYDIPTIEEVKK